MSYPISALVTSEAAFAPGVAVNPWVEVEAEHAAGRDELVMKDLLIVDRR